MKRSPMPARRKPMSSGSAVLRRGALLRQSEMTRTAASRKPVKRDPAEAKARKMVRARSLGICEVCGRVPATNFQHRQGKAQQGAWSAENGLAVCGMGNVSGCHGVIHQNPAIAYERGWSVRSTSDPATTPVWLASGGWHYLRADGSVTATERSAA